MLSLAIDVGKNTILNKGDIKWFRFTFILAALGATCEYLGVLFDKTGCAPQKLHWFITYIVCEGQQYDLDFETMEHVSIDDYIKMIRLKTAVMLAGCLKSGAIFAQASEADQQAIYDYGIHIGIAFQLKDDILDLYSDTQVFGKMTGGDIKENKKTYLYLTALKEADAQQRQTLLHYFSSTDFDQEQKIQAVKEIYESLKVKEKTEQAINMYAAKALSSLQAVSVAEERKKKLYELANTLVSRNK